MHAVIATIYLFAGQAALLFCQGKKYIDFASV